MNLFKAFNALQAAKQLNLLDKMTHVRSYKSTGAQAVGLSRQEFKMILALADVGSSTVREAYFNHLESFNNSGGKLGEFLSLCGAECASANPIGNGLSILQGMR